MDARKKIVILGAGFGGLRAAKALAKHLHTLNVQKKYEVLLVDKNDHHTYTPLLYEVATTSKETADICDLHQIATYKIQPLIQNTGVGFIQKEVEHIDPIGGSIYFAGGEKISCYCIVLALGSETNYFGIPGLQKYSLPFKTLVDAIRIRDAVWNRAMETPGEIRIIIGGAGSTGVELAAELKNWCGELEKEFHGCRLRVTLIEAAPSVLPGFDRRIVAITAQRLKQLGVEIIVGKKIARAEKKEVVLENGKKIDFDVFVWTGGVKAVALLSKIPIQTEERNRAVVGEGMECLPQTPHLKLASRVYGLGDSVCFYDPITKKPIPGVARAAISQADIVAWNIAEEIRVAENVGGAPHLKIYKPMEYPYVIPVGGKYAVAKIGPVLISGFLGWILKGLVELNYLLSIMSGVAALRIWFKGLSIFARNKRLG